MSKGDELTHDQETRLAEIADEFTSQIREGHQPDIEAFVREFPGVENIVREVLKSVELMYHVQRERPGTPTDSDDVSPPERVGEFEILDEAGRGGMGVIYRARQATLNRVVALKVLPVAASLDPVKLRRFQIETQSASMLQHPNIIAVYGSGTDGGLHYFAMQFIEGYSLDRYLRFASRGAGARAVPSSTQRGDGELTADSKRGTLAPVSDRTSGNMTFTSENAPSSQFDVRQIVVMIRDAALALQHAHECGVLHRDIKPSNLMIDRKGKLWVTDFGLAHIDNDATVTKTGDIVGTLRYMSPEQVIGGSMTVDHRCDIYSLGATLYELLTLQPMIQGDERATILRYLTQLEPVPPRKHQRGIHRDLETIVLKATAKSPAERYATAGYFADDLQRFLDDRPILARRPSPLQIIWRAVRRNQATTAAICLLPVAIIGALIWNGISVSNEKQRVITALDIARRNEGLARREATKSKQISNVLQQILASANPSQLKGTEYTVRQLLDDLGPQFFHQLDADPDVSASLRSTIGNAYRALGAPQRALPHLEAVLAWNLQAHADDAPAIANSLLDLAWAYSANTDHERAVKSAREAVSLCAHDKEHRARTQGTQAVDQLSTLLQARWCLQHCLIYQGGLVEADAIGYESISLARTPQQPPAVLANIMHDLAQSKLMQQDYAEAERLAKEAVELHTRLHGPMHPETGWGIHVLAKAYQGQGKYLEAEVSFRRALAIFTSHYSSRHKSVLITTHFLRDVLVQLGRAPEASQLEMKTYQGSLQELLSAPQTEVHSFLELLLQNDQALGAGALVMMAPEMFKTCDDCLVAMNVLTNYESSRQALIAAQTSTPRDDHTLRAVVYQDVWLETMRDLMARAADTCPESAPALNVVAWTLAAASDPQLQMPQQAIDLAQRAVSLSPNSAQYAKTLGLAYIRHGDDDQALQELARSRELAGGGDEYDDLFLLMVRCRQGQADEANKLLDRARANYAKHNARDLILEDFLRECDFQLEALRRRAPTVPE